MNKALFLTRPIVLIVLMLATLSLACKMTSSGNNPPSASKPAADLEVIDRREVDIEGFWSISLSPDGQWLFGIDRQDYQVCIYATETIKKETCAKWKDRIDVNSPAWSPDSKHVAFTQDLFRYFRESDLWVMAVENGDLKNLTDDGVDKFELTDTGETFYLDALPLWPPDGKHIYFLRIESDRRDATDLYSIGLEDEKPEKMDTLVRNSPFAIWRPMHITADGKKIFYTLMATKLDDPKNGLWVVNTDTLDGEQLVGSPKDSGVPMLLDVSPKGEWGLALYSNAQMYATQADVDKYLVLVDLKTGETEPVILGKPKGEGRINPVDAIFSPDGSKVLYLYYDTSIKQSILAVRDVEGEEENILLAQDNPTLGCKLGACINLIWGLNDRLFVAQNPNGGLLLDIGVK